MANSVSLFEPISMKTISLGSYETKQPGRLAKVGKSFLRKSSYSPCPPDIRSIGNGLIKVPGRWCFYCVYTCWSVLLDWISGWRNGLNRKWRLGEFCLH